MDWPDYIYSFNTHWWNISCVLGAGHRSMKTRKQNRTKLRPVVYHGPSWTCCVLSCFIFEQTTGKKKEDHQLVNLRTKLSISSCDSTPRLFILSYKPHIPKSLSEFLFLEKCASLINYSAIPKMLMLRYSFERKGKFLWVFFFFSQ